MQILPALSWRCLAALALTTLALTTLLAAPAIAQVDTGTISGTVKDAQGGVLPGASVTITHEGQALTLTTVTRQDGTYIFTPIRTGAYRVEISATGRGALSRFWCAHAERDRRADNWRASRERKRPEVDAVLPPVADAPGSPK